MWVKRILKEQPGSWKIYPDYLLSKVLGKHSFQCTHNREGFKSWMPMFYRQIFDAWEKTKVAPVEDPFKIRREILWFNKNIKIKGKEICYRKWYEKGIVMLHDLVNENGDFIDSQVLSNKYGIEIKVMDYNSLKSAIPQVWKRALKTMKIPQQAISSNEQPYLNCNNRLLALNITLNRDVYWELVSKKTTRPICALKWCTRYNIEIEDWKSLYKFYGEIKDAKLKAFQFKILNNLLPCNLYLSRIGKSDTNKCNSCNDMEDITHYLANCPASEALWKGLSLWWKEVGEQEIKISERDIILGLGPRLDAIKMKDQLNYIILAAKRTIHAKKQMGEICSFFHITAAIKQMLETLSFIADKNLNTAKHIQKWGTIIEHLP
jgi:hypothetical protein